MITAPSEWQANVLDIPDDINLGLFGGRGAGRTTCALFGSIRHAEKYGNMAHVLFIRQTLRSLREVEDNFQLMLTALYPGLRVNRQDHVFMLPSGATIEFAPLNDTEDMGKLQGRSFSMIVADEYGNFSPQQMRFVDALRANLRAGDVPTRMILLANPGGRGHSMIKSRFVDRMTPWLPHEIDGDTAKGILGTEWVLCPASFDLNPFLPKSYASDLFSAAQKDKELYRAWAKGEWNIARGAMFGDCLDEEMQMIAPDSLPWSREYSGNDRTQVGHRGAYGFVSCDWGQSSPAVAFACWRLLEPFGKFPRGSLIIHDEVTSADPDDWALGMNWSIGKLADNITEMCDRTGVYKMGVIDDARGLSPDDTLIGGMGRAGLTFKRPQKNRRSGWASVREGLTNSKEKNGKPGIWIASRCHGFWATVPVMPRDPKNAEDVDTRSIDHWGDTARYAATYEVGVMRVNNPAETLRRYGIGGPGAPRMS